MPEPSSRASISSRRKILLGIAALGATAGIIGIGIQASHLLGSESDNKIRIGVLAPVSGMMSGHGESIESGATIAVEQINGNGGILGRKVELVVLDTKSDPPTAAERARELVNRYHVSLMLGTGTSAESLAVISEAERSQTPFVYSLDGEDKTCRHGDPNAIAPMVWGSGFTERMAVRPLLTTLTKTLNPSQGKLRVYFIGGDYVYPRTTNAYAIQVAKELGLDVIGDEYSDTATQDYTPVIRRIAAAKPDLLIVTNPGASGVTFMKQARQLGLDKAMAISGFATFDQEALTSMGDASEGVYVVNRYSKSLDNPANAEFLALFRTRYPKATTLPGPTAAAGSYGVVMVAKAALEKAGSTDRDKFTAALNGLVVDLPQGTIKVSSQTHVFEQPLYIMQIKRGEYTVVSKIPMTVQQGFEGCSVK